MAALHVGSERLLVDVNALSDVSHAPMRKGLSDFKGSVVKPGCFEANYYFSNVTSTVLEFEIPNEVVEKLIIFFFEI